MHSETRDITAATSEDSLDTIGHGFMEQTPFFLGFYKLPIQPEDHEDTSSLGKHQYHANSISSNLKNLNIVREQFPWKLKGLF